MIKKLLAVFLAMLVVLGTCAVFAAADEPVYEADYRIMRDKDFTTITEYTEGNAKATILYPGDTIFLQNGETTNVAYYPDVDANVAGDWVAQDASLTAFSLSARVSYTDEVPKARFVANNNTYTVLGLDQKVNAGTANEASFDFTICYPESNTFVGWVVHSYVFGANNKINLYALWDKKVGEDYGQTDEKDDLTTILDTNFTWIQKLMAPVLAYNKQLMNSILDSLQAKLDEMTGTETEDNGDIGAYRAAFQSFTIAVEILARWLDSWVTPIMNLFD
jgi:hypothetical protein